MKNITKLTLIFASLILFSGCGDGSSTIKNSIDNNYGTNQRMIVGEEYIVNRGDEIEKLSSNPKIKIVTNLEKNITTATLISGEAAIIKH